MTYALSVDGHAGARCNQATSPQETSWKGWAEVRPVVFFHSQDHGSILASVLNSDRPIDTERQAILIHIDPNAFINVSTSKMLERLVCQEDWAVVQQASAKKEDKGEQDEDPAVRPHTELPRNSGRNPRNSQLFLTPETIHWDVGISPSEHPPNDLK